MASSSRPSISIIIACFNYGRYLNSTLESVLGQTLPPDEIVVVDDGSTDNTREVMESYGTRIKCVLQANMGHNAAKSNGFNASRGEVVMFLDADDYLLPSAIEESIFRFDASVSKVQFDLELCDAEGRLYGRRLCDFFAGYDAARVARDFRISGTYLWPISSGNLYARSLVQQVLPVDPPTPIDGILNTVAPLYGRVETVAKTLGGYRDHNTSMSRQNDFSKFIAMRRREFEYLRLHAKKLDYRLPDRDFLDGEIRFVNYRLMLRKQGQRDEADASRPLRDLWWTGIKAAWSGPFRWRARMKHFVWLSCLAVAPGSLARVMIQLRFNRAQVVMACRDFFGRLRRFTL